MNCLKTRLMAGFLAAGMAFGCQTPSANENKKPEPVEKKASATETPVAKPSPKPERREFNDVARFLAGLPAEEGSRLTEVSGQQAFTRYSASFDKSWTKLNASKVDVMKKWASEEMAEISRDTATLFYPFSGPDFLHAHTFFPGSHRYVLVALEPVGSVPKVETMTPDAVDQLFASVDRSLDSVLNFSFFKTNNMKVDLNKEVDGTLPILMVFLARTGNQITDIKSVELDNEGNVVQQATHSESRPGLKGVEIRFRAPGDATERRLEYFSLNLQNDYLKKSPPAFLNYVGKLGPVNTYLKSASYLMYKGYFSTIRKTILDRSAFVLEDDSAIPYKYFPEPQWSVSLYGVYQTPIEMFKDHHQADLEAAYKKPGAARPLPFGIGYSWRPGQSNLLAARKKQS